MALPAARRSRIETADGPLFDLRRGTDRRRDWPPKPAFHRPKNSSTVSCSLRRHGNRRRDPCTGTPRCGLCEARRSRRLPSSPAQRQPPPPRSVRVGDEIAFEGEAWTSSLDSLPVRAETGPSRLDTTIAYAGVKASLVGYGLWAFWRSGQSAAYQKQRRPTATATTHAGLNAPNLITTHRFFARPARRFPSRWASGEFAAYRYGRRSDGRVCA